MPRAKDAWIPVTVLLPPGLLRDVQALQASMAAEALAEDGVRDDTSTEEMIFYIVMAFMMQPGVKASIAPYRGEQE